MGETLRGYEITKVTNENEAKRMVVEIALKENGNVVDNRIVAFPYVDGKPMTEADITAEVERYTRVYFEDLDAGVIEKQRLAEKSAGDEIATNLTGKEGQV